MKKNIFIGSVFFMWVLCGQPFVKKKEKKVSLSVLQDELMQECIHLSKDTAKLAQAKGNCQVELPDTIESLLSKDSSGKWYAAKQEELQQAIASVQQTRTIVQKCTQSLQDCADCLSIKR